MGSWTKWLTSKVKEADRLALLHEIMDMMSMAEQADIINDRADELNNKGYDWGVFSSHDGTEEGE